MIFFVIFIIMILLTLSEFGFVVSFKHPSLVAKILQLPRKSPMPKIIFGISMVSFVFLLFLFLKQLSSPQPNPIFVAQIQKDGIIPNTDMFKQIGYENFTPEAYYYYLYTGYNKSPQALQTTAKYIRSSVCKRPCSISFYDDVLAYTKDRARSSIVSDQIMHEWNITNYVYVADHFLGYYSPQATTFTYYPYKDWYYRQLKDHPQSK